MHRIVICLVVVAGGLPLSAGRAQAPKPAPVHELLLEAEEFQVTKGPWRVIGLGENYYAATLANTFISRQKLLSAPEQCEAAEATRLADIPEAGPYRVWTRYECPSNFAVEHTLRIEQGGKVVFERKYGAVTNPKLWPFAKGMTPMVQWDWGSGDNVVWEPSPQVVPLVKGTARFTLLAGKQPADLPRGGPARRNIDCIYLTTDAEFGIKDAAKQFFHVLDRVLNQQGECYLRVSNPAGAMLPLSAKVDVKTHNPYWQPRGPLPPGVSMLGGQAPVKDPDWIAPGQSSPWVAIGQALDTTNMQELIVTAQYKLAAGQKPPAGADFVVELARDAAGQKPLRRVPFQHAEVPSLILEVPSDLRVPQPVIRTLEEWHEDLLTYLRSLPPIKTPTQVPVFGILGAEWHGWPAKAPDRFYHLRTETGLLLGRNTWLKGKVPADLAQKYKPASLKNLEIDVRGVPTADLAKHLRERKAKGELDQVLIVSMGDEIGVGGFDPANVKDNEAFRVYLQQAGSPVPPAAAKLSNDPKADPKLYYWSQMFGLDRGIADLRERTRIVEEVLGKGVYTGANYSPHPHYWPHAGQWVRLFRQHGMTMPWSEDWTFQVPEASMQTAGYLCDVMRCAGRDGNLPIEFYTMPHAPGQTPRDLTLSFYSALAHGNKVLNFFAAVPIYDYTENYTSWEARGNWKAVHDLVGDVGQADDLIWQGKVRPAQVAMLVSHVNDIWEQARGSSIYNCERKQLYYALRHAQVPVDFVTEEDVADGKLNEYKVLFLCGDHMLRRAAKPLGDWVADGGTLVSVAGGGLRDEFDAPLEPLKDVYGITAEKLTLTEKHCLTKEGLAWLPALAEVREREGRSVRIPALAALQELTPAPTAEVLVSFADGKPSLLAHSVEKGKSYLFAFFPGCAYMQQAIPRRPFDRCSSDAGFNHFLPVHFNEEAAQLVLLPVMAAGVELPVVAAVEVGKRGSRGMPAGAAGATPPLDLTVIDAPGGLVVPVANYSGRGIERLAVTIHAPGTFSKVYAARAGQLQAERDGEFLTVRLPVEWADLIVLRK
jgi:hypothetical protein